MVGEFSSCRFEHSPLTIDKLSGEVEGTLGDLILNNVVDQLLDGTLPASSAANILVSSSQEDMDTMDVISRPIPITNEGRFLGAQAIIIPIHRSYFTSRRDYNDIIPGLLLSVGGYRAYRLW